jgi:hypothetical protein
MVAIASVLALLLGQGEPATFFEYDREAPLDFRVSSEERVEGLLVEDVSYSSARKGRAPGYLSEESARRYVKAAGDSHQTRWYFTSHEFNDPGSPRDRMEFLRKKLSLAP